jgi:hypothetical protein
MLTTTSYPSIVIYRHHFMAILYSQDDKALTAVGNCIAALVPAGHIELPMLVAAGQERREEIKNKIGARAAQEITH